MALFTDREVVTLDDLLISEKSLVEVSSTHAIDIEAKITTALSAVSDRLMLWLLRSGAADPQNGQRRTLGLATVVVSPVLTRWICFEALARVYAEAYNVQLNTRFQGKLTEYKQQAAGAADLVLATGVGIVDKPLPKPAKPSFQTSSGNIPEQTIYTQVTFVGATGEESAASPVNACILNGSQGLSVSMALSDGPVPLGVTGWNLYAGNVEAEIGKQNDKPLPLDEAWNLPSTGLTAGSRPSSGQTPTKYVEFLNCLRRG